MKKLIMLALLTMASAASAQIIPAPTVGAGSGNSYNGYLANEPGLAYNKAYQIDMAQYDGSRVSAQVIYGSATFTTNPTFSDGRTCAASITVVSTVSLSGVTLSINGTVFTAGSSYKINTTAVNGSSVTAANLRAAIGSPFNNATYSQVANSAIVYATGTINGTSPCSFVSSNYALISTATISSGQNPSFALGGNLFSSNTVTGFTLALPVLYTAGASPAIGGLVSGTTYYARPQGQSAYNLAKYSTSAVAGIDLVIVTSTNTGSTVNSYTLSPLAIGGAPAFTWQSSNDGANWATALTTGTVTVSYTNPPTDSLVDFGFYNFRYLRLNVTGPTSGGLFLQVPVNIKQDGIGRF